MPKSIVVKEEIVNYIKRSVVDIARKCGVHDTTVIDHFKQIYK